MKYIFILFLFLSLKGGLNAQTCTVTISNPTPSVCLGNSAVLTASGATTYSWSNGATMASISVSPTVTTIYTVTGVSGTCTQVVTTTVNLGCPFNYNNIGYKAKWTNLYGTSFRRDSLLVNGTPVPDGYPTAISKNTLLPNTDGWAEQIIGSPICSNYAMGFCDSAAARNGDYLDIDFAIHVYINYLYLFSNGNISYLGTVTNGDTLRIERIGSNYNLKKNRAVLYTVAAPASKNLKLKGVMNVDPIVNIGCSFGDSTGINFPNYVQAKAATYNSTGLDIYDGKIALTPSFGNTGYTYLWATTNETTSTVVDKNQGIYQVTIKDTLQNASTYTYSIDYKVNWSVLEGCSLINDSLVPSEPYVGTGWSDAISDNLLLQGSTGEISWNIDNFTGDKVIGLFDIITADAGSYSDIDDGIYQSGNALYQKSQDVYTLISYCAIGDVIKMAKNGNYINYYRNGNLISTATTINTAVDLKIKAAFTVNTPPIKIKTSFVSFNPPVVAYNDSQLNWHQEETFDENGNVIGTQKTYLDNLGRATQDLVKNATNEVFTSQTVYDSYGRPAISTMPAFTGNALAYQSWFMRAPNGQEYNYSHFDTPSTLNAPTLLSTSLYNTLGNYYSNTNPYDAYQAIADNPYSRIEYTGDPGGSQRRVSKPGNAFKMGSGKENYSFSMISGDELKFVFGVATSYKAIQKLTDKMDCTPLATGDAFEIPVEIIASKQISISPDNVETISYSVGNKLIATCFAGLSAGETCNNLVSVSNKMYYKGTKSVDVHLPNADKNSLYLPLPLQGPTNSTTVTPSNSIVFSITDLYTDTPLFDITDYTIDASRNVIFNSVFLNKYLNKSLFLRISYYYTPAYEAALSISSTVPPADGALTYNLSYGRFSKNYYDFGGALRKSVSPKGFACNTPTLITMATTYDYDYRGQLIAKKSPDEGLVEMTYDKEGKLRFSQNAEQKINNRFTYLNYDKHARPYEHGEYQSVNATGSAWFTNYYLLGPPSNSVGVTSASIIDQQDGLLDAQKTNTSIASYLVPNGLNNIPSGYSYISQYQSFRNGQVNFVKNKNSTVWFNYDKVGRKTATITQITEADFVAKKPAINDQIKTSESSYNYFTGITNNATYQLNNSSEKLFYQYSYDANYKPTVTNLTYGSISQNLNSYFYTKMGQLKRTVISNNLQGLDFVYTLNGGLKAINHPGLDASLDPGADNGDYSGTNPALVNKDLFGEIIEFYNGDYHRNNTNINSSISVGNSKYNNLIYGVRFKTRAQVNATNTGADWVNFGGSGAQQLITSTGYNNQELSFTYNYDEFNQLAKTTFNTYNNSTNTLSQRSEYAETGAGGGNIAYDKNGNITRLVRQAYNSVVLDDLTNTIEATTNKLTAIVDAASNSYPQSVNFKTPSQISTSPFVYNSIGQLTQSSAENISAITYMPDGKVKTITFTNGNTTTYEYGAGGDKLKSKFYNPTTNKTKYTWYVGPYIYEFDQAGANTFNIAEVKVGGAVIRVNAASVSTGYLVYQVTDHLGNVRATYKSNGTGNGIDILSYNDYYAFGGQLPGRNYTAENHRFGYQGQEKGDASNPWYQFELRMYNQDIGRWFAPDPYGQFASPYIAMANNPVSCVDPDGGYVSMKQGGEYSREYMKLHQTGMFAPQEMRDRYKREFEDIKERFLNGDVIGQDKRNLDNFYNEMLDLNNRYLGLLKYTGIEIGMQNGTDFMTKNEVHTLKVDGRLAAINDQVGVGHASFGTQFSDNTSMEDASSARKLSLNSRVSSSARFAIMNKGKGDKDSQGSVVGTKTEVYNGNGSETHYYYNLNGELTAVIEKGANGSLTQTYNNEIFKDEVVVYSSNISDGSPGNGWIGGTTTLASKENVISEGVSSMGDYYKLSSTVSYQGKQSVLNVNATVTQGKFSSTDVSLNIGPFRITINPQTGAKSSSIQMGAMRVSVGTNNGSFQYGTTIRNSIGFGVSSNLEYRPGGYSFSGAIVVLGVISGQPWLWTTTSSAIPLLAH
jgi:RHS repeat-associated protein